MEDYLWDQKLPSFLGIIVRVRCTDGKMEIRIQTPSSHPYPHLISHLITTFREPQLFIKYHTHMDYSDRVNAKKGGGGVADSQETNVHTRRRIKELLTSQILDIDNDPYVFKNHLGLLECKLCLTTHVSESSYISHLSGRKHGLNLEKRRILDEKLNNRNGPNNNQTAAISITSANKRTWKKVGKPAYKVTKVRHPDTLQLGFLVKVLCPLITVEEPFFRIMSYFELTTKNQNIATSFLDLHKPANADSGDMMPENWQYLVVSAEPYENIAIAIPNNKTIDKPEDSTMSDSYWWFYDPDTKDLFLQFLFK